MERPRLVPASVTAPDLLALLPAQVKRIRSKRNVPRERFWTAEAGDYRIVRLT